MTILRHVPRQCPIAEMLAAPFQDGPPGATVRACPVDAVGYEARFGQETLRGVAWFRESDGICSGHIGLGESGLRKWFNGFPQRDTDALDIIGIRPGGVLGRAALGTPTGLHDLRTHEGEGGPVSGRVWCGPVFSIRFIEAH